MIRAIQEYEIQGVATTLPFGLFVMQHPAFQSGQFDTSFIAKYYNESNLYNQPSDEQLFSAALTAVLQHEQASGVQGAIKASYPPTSPPTSSPTSPPENKHLVESDWNNKPGFAPWRINRGF
jgi:acetyl/propionyl-CoA carboxylase alpha subunit